jgi:phage terminase small subunit
LIVPPLAQSGIVTSADQASLAGLCDWWAQYLAASRALRAIDDYADPSVYRLLNQAAVAWKSFAGIAAKFGLTPSDRAALRLPLEQPVNSIEGFARTR